MLVDSNTINLVYARTNDNFPNLLTFEAFEFKLRNQ